MNYAIEISEAAEADLRDAFLWYEKEAPELGIKFEKQILIAFQYIQKNPLKVQIKYRDVRVDFAKKFPFGIHFKISDNVIIVIAVFHAAENPDKWNIRT
jgi:plasmid stabilization system protein ParE